MSYCSHLFLVVAILVTACAATVHRGGPITVTIDEGRAKIQISNEITLQLLNKQGVVHQATLGKSIPLVGRPAWTSSQDEFSAIWKNGIKLTITAEKRNPKLHGVNVKWSTRLQGTYVEDCQDLGDYNWYGGSEEYNQPWLVQTQDFAETSFVPNGETGGVLDRYFLSSGGFAIYVGHEVPLFASLSTADNALCLKASYDSPYRNTEGRPLELDYKVLHSDPPGLLLNHLQVLYTYLGVPSGLPSEKVIRQPIWSTWAKYKSAITQDTVLAFAQEIYDNGFPASQIEIDDKWETCYGNEVFDPDKFPDPAGMVASIKALGYDVTLWVHPFVNNDCDLYQEGDANKYFVTSGGYNVTGTTNWWNGQGAIIDITKKDAADWWYQRLDKLRTEVGITSFKFDAGETSYLPSDAYLNATEDLQPGIYSKEYAEFSSQFGSQIEVRVGFGSQTLPNFVRIMDRDSRWGTDNGLKSVLTSSLHFGIVGYPYILPDYIGGNAYGTYPDKELFLRWVALSTFLPVMQFSITPWSYDEETTNITRKFMDLRETMNDAIVNAANLAYADGYPIIRPLWWLDATDTTAQAIDDEFLVGDSFLVAPIFEQGATSRDIYLPIGDWVDENNNLVYTGPIWVRNVSVPLDQVPYFALAMC